MLGTKNYFTFKSSRRRWRRGGAKTFWLNYFLRILIRKVLFETVEARARLEPGLVTVLGWRVGWTRTEGSICTTVTRLNCIWKLDKKIFTGGTSWQRMTAQPSSLKASFWGLLGLISRNYLNFLSLKIWCFNYIRIIQNIYLKVLLV